MKNPFALRDSLFSEEWIQIVFGNKNQNYGAYQLRLHFNYRLLFSLLIGTGIITGAFLTSFYFSHLHASALPKKKTADTVFADLVPPTIHEKKNEHETQQQKKSNKEIPIVVINDSVIQHIDTTSIVKNNEGSGISTDTSGTSKKATSTGNLLVSGGSKGIVSDTPKTFVEVMPEFPGGEAEMMKYLMKNIQTNRQWRQDGDEGTIVYQFVVNKEGRIADVKIQRDGVSYGLAELNKSTFLGMPKWKPGFQNGHPVNVLLCIPVIFKKAEW